MTDPLPSAPSADGESFLSFTQRGGFFWGHNAWLGLHGTWPFGKIEVRPGSLTLHCFPRRFVFTPASVEKLTVQRSWWGFGALHVRHAVEGYPAYIAFGSFDIRKLERAVIQAGFSGASPGN